MIAVAAKSPFVAKPICDGDGTNCRLQRIDLALDAGSELLLTASGRYVVAIDDGSGLALTFDLAQPPSPGEPLDAKDDVPLSGAAIPRNLIASLRGDDHDWVVGRDADGQLVRFNPATQHGERIGANVDSLGVVSVGERYLVGREIHSGGEETLYLVDVAGEEFANDHEAVPLLRGNTFSRVTLTPRDDMVIATSGTGDEAETFVFDLDSGTLLDRFRGAQISGRDGDDDLPGMRAVSPDGSALAYRTPMGAVALRGLDSQASCVVRSASAGDHAVAGFSADGILYLESDEGPGRSHVFAFDPSIRRLTALGDPDEGMTLVAVPGRELRDGGAETGTPLGHWALGVHGGTYLAMMEDAADVTLDLDEIAVLARDDTALWLVDKTKDADNDRRLDVRRLAPAPTTVARQLALTTDEDDRPELYDAAGEPTGRFSVPLARRSKVCLTTGAPGAWGFGCGSTEDAILIEASPGDREQTADPGSAPAPQPQIDPEG